MTINGRSEEAVVAFRNVDDSVHSVEDFSQDGEVVVMGEVARLDLELDEGVVVSDEVDHGFGDLCVFELVGPVVVMVADLLLQEAPVGDDFGVHLNNYVAHINQ